MKAKKLVSILLMIIIAVFAVAMVACHKDDREPGDETGTYYCEKNGSEYFLNLNGGNRFALELKDEKLSGEFTIDGDRITFEPKNGDSFGGTYTNDTVWVDKEGGLMFVRMVEFTVNFDTNGGSAVSSVNVINGKRLTLPQAPTYEGHQFKGWYYDNNTFTQAFNNEPIVKSLTLYARWADITDATEYTISFDLNYEGAKELASVKTQGSSLIDVITPEARSGFNFGGWWISDSEKGDELSRKLTNDTVFGQDTTLFALWLPTTGLLEPQAEVTSTGVVWNHITEATFRVEVISNESNETVINETPNTESLNISWDSLPAGFYTVKVTYTTRGQSATATRSYLNRGLYRVSNFSVEGTTLVYGEVPNAEKYIITVLCGNDKHTHENFDNSNYTVYDFGNCPPVTEGENAGNIVINVTAVADGYYPSTTTKVIHRALDEIDEIVIDETTEIASWAAVKNATNYIMTIAGCENDSHNHTAINIGNTKSFDISECYAEDGEALEISVYPAAKGYYSAQPTKVSFTRTRPMAPSNIKVKGSKITWDAVEGATSYTVYVGGVSKSVTTPEVELDTADWKLGENYVVEIATVKGSANSIAKKIDVSFIDIYKTIKYNAGEISWRHVVKVDHYEVYVNDVLVLGNFNGNSAKIEFNKSGANEIKVVAFIDAAGDEKYEATLTINTYKITLNANGGSFGSDDEAPEYYAEYYKAKGDMLSFDTPTRKNYEFDGWYLTPFGGKGNGARFDDTAFFNDSDLYLYADWRGSESTVDYEAGGNAAQGFPTSAKLAYGEYYKLDVPTAIDGTKIFAGWASTQGATVADLTDAKGNSYNVWLPANDDSEEEEDDEEKVFTVYAVWINAFQIVDEYSTSVTIKGADGLQYVDEIVVPKEIVVNSVSKTVVGISDLGFQNYKNLKKISIPNTIKNIEEYSFRGMTNLLEIEVYDAGESSPVYVSDDGVLLRGSSSSDDYEIVAFPGAKTSYTIPSYVTEIMNYAFYKSYITSITIPASITMIHANAFEGCRRLRSLTFVDGGADFEIGIQAFKDCTGLTTLALPSRLVQFHFDEASGPNSADMAFVGCTSLSSISIDDRSPIFKSRSGCLLNLNADTLLWCPSGKKGTLQLPSSVNSIGPYAFRGVSGLEIKIDTATSFSVGRYAFSGASFEKLTFSGSGRITIGGYAFSGASGNGIRNLVIPAAVRSIGEYAFNDCNAIETITIEVEDTLIDNNAFSGSAAANLKSVIIKSANNSGNCSVTLGHKLTEGTGDSNVFSGYRSLTDIDISADYINIPFSYAISGNSSIKNLRIAATKMLSMYSTDNAGIHKEAIKADCKTYESVEITGLNDDGSAPTLEGLFAGCKNLKKVKIGGTASIAIGANAFSGCTSLTEENLSLPDTLIYFDATSFANTGLTVNEENGAKYLQYKGNAHYALMSVANNEISSFNLNQNTKIICSNVFSEFKNLTSITFHEGLIGIGARAFYGCSSLSAINLPDSLVGIGPRAFYNAGGTATITMGTGLQFIDSYAFEAASRSGKLVVKDISAWFKIKFADMQANPVYKLYSIYDTKGNEITVATPTGITEVNAFVAFNWRGLKEVVIPEGVTYIGQRAFGDGSGNSYLSGLTTVTFPSTLQEVGADAFYNCSKITKLIIKDSETLSSIKFATNQSDPRNSSRNCVVEYTNVVTEVVIPDGTRGIAANTYNGLKTLKTVTIPSSVSSIGANAFGGCTGIEKIIYNGTLQEWLGISFADGNSNPWKNNATLVVLDAKDRKTPVEYPRGSTVEIPSSVGSIGRYTFYEGNLETIVLHERIETIGLQAFAGCATLRKVIVPNVESWFTIAFEGAVTNGNNADDPYLGKVNTSNPLACNANVKFYVGNATASTLMTSIMTPSKVSSLKAYVFSGVRCFNNIEISADVTAIYGGAFTGCTAAVTFESGSKLKTISADAFNNYAGTATITLPDGLQSIGAYAFYGCKFSSIVFGTGINNSSLTTISSSAFMNCRNLSSVTLPNKLTTIQGHAFRNCSALRDLFIPISVKNIGTQAFNGCTGLTLRVECAESDLPSGWTTTTPPWNQGVSSIRYGQSR